MRPMVLLSWPVNQATAVGPDGDTAWACGRRRARTARGCRPDRYGHAIAAGVREPDAVVGAVGNPSGLPPPFMLRKSNARLASRPILLTVGCGEPQRTVQAGGDVEGTWSAGNTGCRHRPGRVDARDAAGQHA